MSVSSFKKFCKAVNGDKELGKEIQRLRSRYPMERISVEDAYKFIVNDVIPFAKEHGYEFTFKDTCITGRKEGNSGALSDEDLAAVTGGFSVTNLALGMGLLATSAGVGAGVVANLSGNQASTPSVSQSASVSAPGQQSQSAEVKQEAEKVDEAAAAAEEEEEEELAEEGLNEESEDSEEGAKYTIDFLSGADESEEEDAGESKSEFSWKDLKGIWGAEQEKTESEKDKFQKIKIQKEQVAETNHKSALINDEFKTPSSSSGSIIAEQEQDNTLQNTTIITPGATQGENKETAEQGESNSDSSQEKVEEESDQNLTSANPVISGKGGGTPTSQNAVPGEKSKKDASKNLTATPENTNDPAKLPAEGSSANQLQNKTSQNPTNTPNPVTPQATTTPSANQLQNKTSQNPTNTPNQENASNSVTPPATNLEVNQEQNSTQQKITNAPIQNETNDSSAPSILNQVDANKSPGQNDDGAAATSLNLSPDVDQQSDAKKEGEFDSGKKYLEYLKTTEDKLSEEQECIRLLHIGAEDAQIIQYLYQNIKLDDMMNAVNFSAVLDVIKEKYCNIMSDNLNASKPVGQNDDGAAATSLNLSPDVDQQSDAKKEGEFDSGKKYLEYLKTTEDKLSEEQECIKLFYEGKSNVQAIEHLSKNIKDMTLAVNLTAVVNAARNKYNNIMSGNLNAAKPVGQNVKKQEGAKNDSVGAAKTEEVAEAKEFMEYLKSADFMEYTLEMGDKAVDCEGYLKYLRTTKDKLSMKQECFILFDDGKDNNYISDYIIKRFPPSGIKGNEVFTVDFIDLARGEYEKIMSSKLSAAKLDEQPGQNTSDGQTGQNTLIEAKKAENFKSGEKAADAKDFAKYLDTAAEEAKNGEGYLEYLKTTKDKLSIKQECFILFAEGQGDGYVIGYLTPKIGGNQMSATNEVIVARSEYEKIMSGKLNAAGRKKAADFEYSEDYLAYLKKTEYKLSKKEKCIKLFAYDNSFDDVYAFLIGNNTDPDSAKKTASEAKDKYEKLKSTKLNAADDFIPKQGDYDKFCKNLQRYSDGDIIERGELTVKEASDDDIVLGAQELLFMKYGYAECAKNEDGNWTEEGIKAVKEKLFEYYEKNGEKYSEGVVLNTVTSFMKGATEFTNILKNMPEEDITKEFRIKVFKAAQNGIPVNNEQNQTRKRLLKEYSN